MQLIDNNLQAFLSLLRGGLWEQKVQIATYDDVYYSEIYRLAEEQSVIGLVTAGIENVTDVKVPQEVLLQFVGNTLQIEQRNKAMYVFISGLVKKLQLSGICALLLKGQGVAQCYERPRWRNSGDIDLLLSEDNYRKAKEMLMPLAQKIEQEYAYTNHLAMTISQWEVELHGNLRSGLFKKIDRQLDEVKRDIFYSGNVRSWMNDSTQVFLPGATNDAFYIFTHILQHYFKWGIGLRQICDWCRLLWKYKEKLDVRTLERRLRKAGLMSEWKAFASLAVNILGMPKETMPLYDDSEKWVKKSYGVLNIVLKSGNMGHNRDIAYYRKYSFVIRKCISLWCHIKDGFQHFAIFPLDSIKVMCRMMTFGLRVTIIGDK